MVAYMQFHMRMKLYFKQSLYERRKPYEKNKSGVSCFYCVLHCALCQCPWYTRQTLPAGQN